MRTDIKEDWTGFFKTMSEGDKSWRLHVVELKIDR